MTVFSNGSSYQRANQNVQLAPIATHRPSPYRQQLPPLRTSVPMDLEPVYVNDHQLPLRAGPSHVGRMAPVHPLPSPSTTGSESSFADSQPSSPTLGLPVTSRQRPRSSRRTANRVNKQPSPGPRGRTLPRSKSEREKVNRDDQNIPLQVTEDFLHVVGGVELYTQLSGGNATSSQLHWKKSTVGTLGTLALGRLLHDAHRLAEQQGRGPEWRREFSAQLRADFDAFNRVDTGATLYMGTTLAAMGTDGDCNPAAAEDRSHCTNLMHGSTSPGEHPRDCRWRRASAHHQQARRPVGRRSHAGSGAMRTSNYTHAHKL